MNFISEAQSGRVPVELKYCERCGGLFLREQAGEVVYCRGCTAHMRAAPQLRPDGRKSSARKTRNPRLIKGPQPQKRGLEATTHIHCLEAVAALEVRA